MIVRHSHCVRSWLPLLAGLLLDASAHAEPADSLATPVPDTLGMKVLSPPLGPADRSPAPGGAWPPVAGSPLIRPDRLQHASLAFAIGLGAGLLSDEPAVAAGSAAALGLAKEIHDRNHGGFDAGDLWADLAGAALAALAIFALNR